ncbi:prepilin-type N-terminal cleavage/methylation domain-containing protein [Exiguobacterium sp. ZOR0005]|uniref:prepilin-type N-terminal cleavage/methylation domain-containing protein n=1 Tax=Exiguobacterium sp. ZOR0005 TaxID=1339226 RepID=UPI000648C20F|nr:prepilin-type N-terminal cleavage/methylation domain-containing protein [Exiguobacterium sp. ZOR0005]
MLEKMKMIWQDAKQLKDERGLTLVELLVVVVILGIIAAIAVVAIGGIIENSKKDAMVADAKQMISAAKLHTASNPEAVALDFKEAVGQGYISKLNDPFGENYSTALVTITPDGNKYSYSVQLIGKKAIGKTAAVSEENLSKASIE